MSAVTQSDVTLVRDLTGKFVIVLEHDNTVLLHVQDTTAVKHLGGALDSSEDAEAFKQLLIEAVIPFARSVVFNERDRTNPLVSATHFIFSTATKNDSDRVNAALCAYFEREFGENVDVDIFLPH